MLNFDLQLFEMIILLASFPLSFPLISPPLTEYFTGHDPTDLEGDTSSTGNSWCSCDQRVFIGVLRVSIRFP